MGRFDYQQMVHDALRQVVRAALEETAEHGLVDDHHFYITFHTRAPGVGISSRLLERFPETMTIVLQHQFWDLVIEPDRFAVTLSFDQQREPLTVPFAAVAEFVDPGAEFGLRFEPAEGEPDGTRELSGDVTEPEAASTAEDGPREAEEADEPDPQAPAEVVSLDDFRRGKSDA